MDDIHRPKELEQYWIFTWGFGHLYPNCYTRIWGTYSSARTEMIRKYGQRWAFQYESEESAGVNRWNLKEIKYNEKNSNS